MAPGESAETTTVHLHYLNYLNSDCVSGSFQCESSNCHTVYYDTYYDPY
jgi:hypothetical protein